MHTIRLGDNLELLREMEDKCVDLIYIDPPFNTGKNRNYKRIRTEQSQIGTRTGFQGKRYASITIGEMNYHDLFDDYLGFLKPRLEEAYRVLKNTGSFFLHLDYREIHYVKILLDLIFGRESFKNEIIWAYDYGARSKKKWSTKHDNILWYAKDPEYYTFNYEEMDRIPYMAPGLVGEEKAKRGKTPTDVWWHTIVPTNGKERTGYPTQKPIGVLKRIILVHSNPGDHVLDFFCGSGTTGEVALQHNRNVTLFDNNLEAIKITEKRLKHV